jgi:hypothetical protein
VGHAICIKATSKVDIYKNNPEMMLGCVYYQAREVSFFGTETVIQPDNPFPILHSHIADCESNGSLQILGNLPRDFQERLRTAIENSSTLSKQRKRNLLKLIA